MPLDSAALHHENPQNVWHNASQVAKPLTTWIFKVLTINSSRPSFSATVGF